MRLTAVEWNGLAVIAERSEAWAISKFLEQEARFGVAPVIVKLKMAEAVQVDELITANSNGEGIRAVAGSFVIAIAREAAIGPGFIKAQILNWGLRHEN